MKLDRLQRWNRFVSRRLRPYRMAGLQWLRPGGVLPDFLIIGAMKSGTTTLFNTLTQHPGFIAPVVKEVQFFNNPRNFKRGEGWYRAHFPTARKIQSQAERLGYRPLSAEATPAMSNPLYAVNAARLVPQARLIVSLRNPVDRAWSHYQHMRRHPIPERNDFAQAIQNDLAWRRQGLQLTADSPRHLFSKLVKRSYVQRGYYVEQLEHWLRFFPRRQFLILDFEQWKRDPPAAARRISRFVGLPGHPFQARKFNAGGYREAMPADCRALLEAHYRPFNRRLFKLLGEDWGWST